MTFDYKGFEECNVHLEDLIKLHEGMDSNKSKLKDMVTPRSTELKFLQAILNKIKNEIEQQKPSSQFPVQNKNRSLKSNADYDADYKSLLLPYYAALNLINKIAPTSSRNHSSINEFLQKQNNTAIKPLEMDIALQKFMDKKFFEVKKHKRKVLWSAFNERADKPKKLDLTHLKLIFKQHADDLLAHHEGFITKCPEQKLSTQALYKPFFNSPSSDNLPENIPQWDNLKEQPRSILLKEKTTKGVAASNQINQQRASALNFLINLKSALDEDRKTSSTHKAAILMGSMIAVSEQIESEYRVTKPTNSLVFNELENILQSKDLADENKLQLLKLAFSYVSQKVIVSYNEGVFNTNHPFYSVDNSYLKTHLISYQKAINKYETKSEEHLFNDVKPDSDENASLISKALDRMKFLGNTTPRDAALTKNKDTTLKTTI